MPSEVMLSAQPNNDEWLFMVGMMHFGIQITANPAWSGRKLAAALVNIGIRSGDIAPLCAFT